MRGTAELVRACLAACDIQSRVTREDFVARTAWLLWLRRISVWVLPDGNTRPADTPNYDISVRTNGGRTFAATDFPAGILSADTTVESLRSMIAQLSDSRPESIRLVNRGTVLRDDSLSLRDAGVRPGDQLMLVVMAGATRHASRPPAYSAPAPAPAVQARLPPAPAVVRPPAYSAPAPAPARRRTTVRVPASAGPGP